MAKGQPFHPTTIVDESGKKRDQPQQREGFVNNFVPSFIAPTSLATSSNASGASE
jgi:hypothetical protein